MTEKQRRFRMCIAWTCMVLWGIFAILLSRQDGDVTLSLSYTISERIVAFLTWLHIDVPTEFVNVCIRKLAHIVIYFCLGIFLYTALAYTLQRSAKFSFLLAVAFCFLASVLDEFQKTAIPGRHCDADDILLNGLAGLLGIACRYFFCIHIKHK